MKSDKHKDITEQMAEKLRNHSLPYKEGAWERFQEFEASKSKRVVLWPYFSAAAAMLIFAFTLFINLNNEQVDVSGEMAKTDLPAEIGGSRIAPPASDLHEEERTVEALELNKIRTIEESSIIRVNNIASDEGYASEAYVAVAKETEAEITEAKEEATHTPLDNKEERKRSTFNDGLYKQDFYQEVAEVKNNEASNSSKWNFSVELSPNIKDNNVNFGGGVAVAYNLTKRLSISSGISYVELDANRGPNQVDMPADAPTAGVSTYNYSKSLNAVNTSLRGLDIPINLKIDINDNMYASAGVSVFSVLDETRYNGYEERVAELSFAGTEKSGSKSPEPLMRTIYSTEVSEETPYEDKNFTGFFNLSVGYRLPFLKKLNLAVEPYLKIPVGSLTEEDMNLSNGGLKIITSF